MRKQNKSLINASVKHLKPIANSILKNLKPILFGVGSGFTVGVAIEEIYKSKERQAQQEKDLLYKEALLKQQAKNDAICEENKELKELLNDIINYNSESTHE